MTSKLAIFSVVCFGIVLLTHADSPPNSGSQDLSNVYASLKECCPSMPAFYNESTVATCGQSSPVPRKKGFGKGGRKNQNCLMQCIFNASGFMNAETKNIDVVVMSNKLKKLAGKTVWAPIVAEALKNCSAIDVAPAGTDTKEPSCNPGARSMSMCLFGYMVDKCPNQQANNVPASECKKRIYDVAKQLEDTKGGNPLGKTSDWKKDMKNKMKKRGPQTSAGPANQTTSVPSSTKKV